MEFMNVVMILFKDNITFRKGEEMPHMIKQRRIRATFLAELAT